MATDRIYKDRPTIMVVDDSRSVRLRLEEMLSAQGFRILLAEDGQDCLEQLPAQNVEMIISDLEMPRLDGMALCLAVKTDPHLRHLYFIMLTRRSEIHKRVQGLTLGADDYIVKTSHAEEFLARVFAGMRLRRMAQGLLHAQAQLFHSEKMASMGQLSAGMAHEINNPIGFIISNLVTLGKYMDRMSQFVTAQEKALAAVAGDSPVVVELQDQRKKLKLDYIRKDGEALIRESLEGAQRIGEIANRMRSLMPVEEFDCHPVDLNHCIDLAIELLPAELGAFGQLRKDFGEIPLTKCYPRQISQGIVNLLTNAAQAISSAGVISLTTWCDEHSIFFSVTDSGCGIPQGNLKRIFDPFFTTRQVGQGIGLGLTVAYDIIRNHDGEIFVDSVPGLGTTVTVRLPVRQ